MAGEARGGRRRRGGGGSAMKKQRVLARDRDSWGGSVTLLFYTSVVNHRPDVLAVLW